MSHTGGWRGWGGALVGSQSLKLIGRDLTGNGVGIYVQGDPSFLPMTRFAHLGLQLHLKAVDEVLCGLVVRVQDQALVTEADQLDVLHLKEEAARGRPALIFLKIFCHPVIY